MSLLHKNIVLVLNKNWQAINVTSPAIAYCQVSTDIATALDIQGPDHMVPVRWADWVKLPVRENDNFIGTPSGPIRVPTVIVLANFSKVPLKRPKLSVNSVWQRDGGQCQYTGKKLKRGEGNLDHVLPRSRGGKSTWNNLVLADKKINTKKSNKTPREAGLKLLREPVEPKAVPVTHTLRNAHKIPDWAIFGITQEEE